MRRQGTRSRRRRRGGLRIVGVVVVLVALFIALLPRLVSWGLGRGLISRAISTSVNGTVAIDELRLRWLGRQAVRGFSITDRSGNRVARIDATIDRTLLSLLLNRDEVVHVTLTGDLTGEFREDGRTSFHDLAASRGTTIDEPFRWPRLPAIVVQVSDLSLVLKNPSTRQELRLDEVDGSVGFGGPSQPVVVELHGRGHAEDQQGSIDLLATASGMFDASGLVTLSGAGATIELRANSLPLPVGSKPAYLHSLTLNLASDDLARRMAIELSADAQIEGYSTGRLTASLSLAEFVAADGTLTLEQGRPVGTVTAEHFPVMLLAGLVPYEADLIEILIGESMNLSATSIEKGGAIEMTIDGRGELFSAQLKAVRQADQFTIAGGRAEFTVTPELAALLQGDREQPILPTEPFIATIDFQPFDLPSSFSAKPGEAVVAMRMAVSVPDAVLENVPAVIGLLGVHDLVADLAVNTQGEQRTYSIRGDLVLRRPASKRVMGRARYHLEGALGPHATMPEGRVAFAELAVPEVEEALGYATGTISRWTGDDGMITAQITRGPPTSYLELQTDFPQLAGTANVTSDGQAITASAQSTRFFISRELIEERMNPVGAPDRLQKRAAARTDDTIQVEDDVPLDIVVETVRVPMAMLKGESFDPDAAELRATASGGPLTLRQAGGIRTSLRDIRLNLTTADMANGIEFDLQAKSETAKVGRDQLKPDSDAEGELSVSGTLTGLLSADSTLQTNAARLNLIAKANEMPTAVLDSLANLRGMLVAALGGRINAELHAENLSADSGLLTAQLTAENGSVNASLRGRNQALRTAQDEVIEAELEITPPLRERLLYKIHPLLADIRTTEQPLQAEITSAVIPVDGDISRLKADLEITIGKVELDSGSVTLALMKLFNRSQTTIPGEIEPILATIRRGVLEYDTFAVHIGNYTLAYSGQIDLVKGTVNLRTEIPLAALAQPFPELSGYADRIVVPLVTRGKFGELKTQIDPKFDLDKAALDAGARGLLGDLFDRKKKN